RHPSPHQQHGRHPGPDPGRGRVGHSLRPAAGHPRGAAARRTQRDVLRTRQGGRHDARQHGERRRDPQAVHRDRPPRVGRRPRHALGDVEADPRRERRAAADQAEGDLRAARGGIRPCRGRSERHRGRRARERMTTLQFSFSVLVFLVALALLFDFMNGFHDAANSIATIVSTGVLKPYQAVVWAAFFNFVALFFFELRVAATVGKGIVDPGVVDHVVIFGAVSGALAWNIITWYFGIPSSSSHALIGGLIGATLAKAGTTSLLFGGISKVALFIVISPTLGFLFGSSLMLIVAWV